MKSMMLPDILDGTKTNKIDKYFVLANISKSWKYVEPLDHQFWKMNFDKMTKDNFTIFEEINNEDAFQLIAQDESLKTFLRAYTNYMKSERNNYLVSKNLAKAFQMTSTDIKAKYLPKDFDGYIEIPGLIDQDGSPIQGFFISIKTYDKNWKFYCGYLSQSLENKNIEICFINIDLNSEETVEECVKKMPYIRQWINKDDGKYITQTLPSEFNPFLGVLFNTIIYICNGEDIQMTQNTFAVKKSKRIAQEKIFTPKKFNLVGYNMSLPKTYSIDQTTVSGHFRWQPHGPSRSLLKHIYIEPHIRTYK